MDDVFVGSAALAAGTLTRGQLRWNYRRLFPDVYIAKDTTPSLTQRALGAWLWSNREGVIAGLTAAALHGAHIGEPTDVELIWKRCRPPRGIVVRNERIEVDEIDEIAGLPVTNPERTALDLARHAPRDVAVAHLDALVRAVWLVRADVFPLFLRYEPFRWRHRAWVSLTLMDGGARTPRETAVRLALIDAGFPSPRTDFTISDGHTSMRMAIGYDAPKVAITFEESDPPQTEWAVIPAAHRTPAGVVNLVDMKSVDRGYPPWRLSRWAKRYPFWTLFESVESTSGSPD
jgi:AbiEi antitoxin C-terminal domain